MNANRFPDSGDEFVQNILACFPGQGPQIRRDNYQRFEMIMGRAFVQLKHLAAHDSKRQFCLELAELLLALLPDPEEDVRSAYSVADMLLRSTGLSPNPSYEEHVAGFYVHAVKGHPRETLAGFLQDHWH